MSFLARVADLVLDRPLLISPAKAQTILAVLSGRIGIDAPEASRFEGSDIAVDADGRARRLPYRVAEGVAVISIVGSLVNRGAYVGASSGLVSYEGIGHQLRTAAADASARAVILDLHSPGGEAVGAFEVAAQVRALAALKPVVAVVNGMAASAAYAIASGAHEIVTTGTGVSGSIGVVLLHADHSRRLDREGITPTLIHAGAHKVDGNPFEPLSPGVREDLQAEVDAFYEAFLTTVAAGRGACLPAAAARATEARTFIGAAAVRAGIADRIGTFEIVLAELQSRARSGRVASRHPGGKMSETMGAPAAEAGIGKAEHDTAVKAAADAARAEGREAGRLEGAAQATARLVAALGSEGVKGDAARMSAALDLAAKSPAMSGEDVAAFVTANVAIKTGADAAGYEANRLAARSAAAGLAQPGAKATDGRPRGTLDAAAIFADRRRQTQET